MSKCGATLCDASFVTKPPTRWGKAYVIRIPAGPQQRGFDTQRECMVEELIIDAVVYRRFAVCTNVVVMWIVQ